MVISSAERNYMAQDNNGGFLKFQLRLCGKQLSARATRFMLITLIALVLALLCAVLFMLQAPPPAAAPPAGPPATVTVVVQEQQADGGDEDDDWKCVRADGTRGIRTRRGETVILTAPPSLLFI